MPTYEIEIIHEPTGEYLNFEFETDEEDYDEAAVLKDLSVVFVETVPDEELHAIDLL
jgi:hypothetical protein